MTLPNTSDERRILVVTNETATSPVLHEVIRAHAGDGDSAEVFVVAPALNSRLRHWLSDDDAARRAAEQRLGFCLEQLAQAGIAASGSLGDADPLQAISDAVRVFAPGLLIIATHPEGRSNWLARRVCERSRFRFGLPLVHVVVDTANGEEYVVEQAPAA